MQYSKDGLHLTERFEGCKLEAYLDTGGVPTIGYGHTHKVKLGDTCTKEQAESFLLGDVIFAEGIVQAYVDVPLTQGQYDALVDFVFNVGSGAFKNSTLLKCLNKKAYNAAARELLRWKYDNGKELAGLLARREAEQDEFTKS
jgi:lysozyme